MIRVLRRPPIVACCCLSVMATCCLPAYGQESSVSPRAELLRKWDIDKNGTIDEGEAEVARAKMRRERALAQTTAGLDPLTGQPRVAGDEPPEGGEDAPVAGLPQADRARSKPDGTPPLPGTRTPDPRPPIPSTAGSRRAGDTVTDAADRVPEAAPRAGAAGDRVPSGAMPFRGLMTGGARAGGAARPGYGAAGPKPDLNAGRLPAGLPGRRPAPASGGLLPNVRTRPVTPPPAPPVPRRTVEDYDVY